MAADLIQIPTLLLELIYGLPRWESAIDDPRQGSVGRASSPVPQIPHSRFVPILPRPHRAPSVLQLDSCLRSPTPVSISSLYNANSSG